MNKPLLQNLEKGLGMREVGALAMSEGRYTLHMDPEPHTSSIVEKRKSTAGKEQSWGMLMGLAGQLAYLIAIPAVVFVLGGAWLDKYLGTTPLLLLLGIPLSFLVAGIGVFHMIRDLNKK